LWKIFQSPHKKSLRHIPSHITRGSSQQNGNCMTYFPSSFRAISQLALHVSCSSHTPPCFSTRWGRSKRWALIKSFRSWRRHRHTYRGNLLDFPRDLLPDIRRIPLSRGNPRLPGADRSLAAMRKDMRHPMHKVKCRGPTKIVNACVDSSLASSNRNLS
jgi:hypothetical protein